MSSCLLKLIDIDRDCSLDCIVDELKGSFLYERLDNKEVVVILPKSVHEEACDRVVRDNCRNCLGSLMNAKDLTILGMRTEAYGNIGYLPALLEALEYCRRVIIVRFAE